MSRRKGRILAFQALYSWDVGGVQSEDLYSFTWVDNDKSKETVSSDSNLFARMLISGTIDHSQEIDKLIETHLTGWDFKRVNKVSLAILRMSVFSLLYQKDLSPTIVIDEAIDIAKEYGAEDSFKFINAVLDNIRKDLVLGV